MSQTALSVVPADRDTAGRPFAEWLEGPYATFLRHWYETLDPDLLPADIHWHNADGSPSSGSFIGPRAVKEGYFVPLRRDFEDWRVTVEEVIGTGMGGYVIVRGLFQGRTRGTHIGVYVPFANFWKVYGGEIVSVQQYTDTRILADALSGKAAAMPLETRA